MKTSSKKYKSIIRIQKNKFAREQNKKIKSLKSKDPRTYWKIVGPAGKEKDEATNKISLEIFCDHFKKLSENNIINTDADEIEIDLTNTSALNAPITQEEVLKAITRLKNGKACGIDRILNEFIKNTKEKMSEIYTNLFNIILNTGIIPETWTLGIIKPLFKKKGLKNDPNNFRGITILSCLGKLFTNVLNERLCKFSDENNIIKNNQAAFRKGYSTLDHIFSLHCLLNIYLSKGQKLYCAFVDYEKAFDKIWHAGLWLKLLKNGIDGKIVNVIKKMYENAKSCVNVADKCSSNFQCNIGVRQGENLSPFLFAVYLNDLSDFLEEHNFKGLEHLHLFSTTEFLTNINKHLKLAVLLYADDTIILSDTPSGLQDGLNALKEYCTTWHLSVNETKTKVVIFSRGKQRKELPIFKYGEAVLEIVDEYKYLGVIFNYDGTFKKCQSDLIAKAKKAMFSLIRQSRKKGLSIEVQLELFDAIISPILCYGSEIHGSENTEEIEKVHRLFCKYILKVRPSTPTVMVYGELGRFPIEISIKTRMISYHCKLKNENDQKWNYTLYQIVKELHDKKYINFEWLTKVQSIYNESGFNDYYELQNPNQEYVKTQISRRLRDQYLQTWSTKVTEDSRCQIYKSFKTELKLESYFDKLPPNLSQIVTNFRLSNVRLAAVNDRIYNKPLEKDICKLCNKEDYLNEGHYILTCTSPEITCHRERLIRNANNVCDVMQITQTSNLDNVLFMFNLSKILKKDKIIKFTKPFKKNKKKQPKTAK